MVPLAAAALFIASCSATSPASTSTATAGSVPGADVTVPGSTTESTVEGRGSSTTGADSSTATEETSSTTAAPVAAGFVPPDPFVSPAPTAGGGGSGCSPGPGPLPDGVWFGFVDDAADTTLDFDLACFQSCDPGSGVSIGNKNLSIRTVPVNDDALVITEAADGPDWHYSYEDWKWFEYVGLHTMVWIYVNGGNVTHIVEPAVAEGCRFSTIRVEWVAQLPPASRVAFNELGLIAAAPYGSDQNMFYWASSGWQETDPLDGAGRGGWVGAAVAAAESSVGIGAHLHHWIGDSWSTEVFDAFGSDVQILGVSEDRVLMSGLTGDDAVVHVATRNGNGWGVETITIGPRSGWETWAGALSGDTFAVSDTGLHTARGSGTVRIYDWDGSTWVLTATVRDQWDTGMWGSSLDLDDERVLVGADGSTPGPGSRGGLYLYIRMDDGWTPQIVGQGGEGFGFGARIDGDTIITAAAHGDPAATFWVFTPSADSWQGTPIRIDPPNADEIGDWVDGLDIHGDQIAVSTQGAVWIGTLRSHTG